MSPERPLASLLRCKIDFFKRFSLQILIYASVLMVIGCQRRVEDARVVNVTIKNSSTNDLNLVELKWEGPDIPAGVMPAGISKTSLGVGWPKLESAKLTFVDDKTRKPYTVDVPFAEINKQIDAGMCRSVVIQIVSFEKVEVVKGD